MTAAPVTPEQLERAVLDAVSRRAVKIPPYPAVAVRVNEAARNPRMGLAEVSRIIRSDAALAADVLRCANSAFFSRGATVTSLTHAVTRIGAQEVMRIALAASLGSYARAPGPLASIRRTLWIENLAGAVICDELARARGGRPEEAFMLGLLHDFGKVVAAAAIESVLAVQRVREPWPLAAWTRLIERLHVHAGRTMATQWNLPQILVHVISTHHEAGIETSTEPLLAVVKASDAVVALLTSSLSVSSDDLAGVTALSPAERDRVAHVVEMVPELVASFEPMQSAAQQEAPTPPPLPSLVRSEHGTVTRREMPPFPAILHVAGRAREYTAISAAGDGLVITGSECPTENRLVKVELRAPGSPFCIWAIVQSCRLEGEVYTAELRPFALSTRERGAWDRLVCGTPEGTPK